MQAGMQAGRHPDTLLRSVSMSISSPSTAALTHQLQLCRRCSHTVTQALRSLWEVEYGPTIQGDGSAGALFFELTDVSVALHGRFLPLPYQSCWQAGFGTSYGTDVVQTAGGFSVSFLPSHA